ncbi:hypothetical protein REPUB_Repub03eG0120100 [Reevesia pubescens]
MTLIRFILTFSLITLLLFSQSLPTSAAADGEVEGVLIPFKRVLLSQPVKAEEKVTDDQVDDPKFDLPEKFGIHMRKVRSGGGVGIGTRARGKTSSAVPTQLSSFHFGSVLACSLFLALIIF